MAAALLEGYLGLSRKKQVEPRFFVLRKDRLEYWKLQEDRDHEEPRGVVRREEMKEASLSDDGLLCLFLEGNCVKLTGLEGRKGAAIDAWFKAILGLGVPNASPGPAAQAADAAAATSSPSGPSGSRPARPAARTSTATAPGPRAAERSAPASPAAASAPVRRPSSREPSRRQAADAAAAPASRRQSSPASPPARRSTAGGTGADAKKAAASPVPLFQGSLGMVHKQRSDENRIFLLFDDRMEYYHSLDEIGKGHPRGFPLKQVDSLEFLAPGLGRVMTFTVAGRHQKLRAPDEEQYEQWRSVLSTALPKGKVKTAAAAPASPPSPASPASRASAASPAATPPQAPEVVVAAEPASPASSPASPTQGEGRARSRSALAGDRGRMKRSSSVTFAAEAEILTLPLLGAADDDGVTNRLDAGHTPFAEPPSPPSPTSPTSPTGGDRAVSDSEREKVKSLKAWVRPGPPPTRRGLFDVAREDGGLASAKYFELYDDGLMYFDAPADARGTSSPFAPEGMIALSDVTDVEPLEGGFRLTCADGTRITATGPKNEAGGTASQWVDALGEGAARAAEAKEHASPPTETRPAHARDPNEEIMLGRVDRITKSGRTSPAEAVLTPTELVLSPEEASEDGQEEEPLPPCSIDIKDLKEVRMNTQGPPGFTVDTLYFESQSVLLPPEDAEHWHEAWDTVLMDGFEQAGDRRWRRREVRRLHSCPLELLLDGQSQPAHGVAYSDRFAVYRDAASAEAGEEAFLEIWPSQVQMVRVDDDGVAMTTHLGAMNLTLEEHGELDSFYDSLRICFARLPCPDEEELQREVLRRQNARNRKELPASASRRAIQKTMADEMDEKDRATCQGMMGFYANGGLKMRYAVLFPERLQAWDKVDSLLADEPPQISVRLDHVSAIDPVEEGLILSVSRPSERKFGVLVGDPEELKAWTKKLLGVLERRREAEEKAEREREQRSRSRSPPKFPQKAKPGFVPRCAKFTPKGQAVGKETSYTQPRMIVQTRSFHPSRHVVPDSHQIKKRGVRINTHRSGAQAHHLVERSGVPNPSDQLGGSRPRPQAPERGDKISNHVDSRAVIHPRYSMCNGLASKPNTPQRS